MKYVIIGDLNARFGYKVQELVPGSPLLNYNPVYPGENDNGKKMLLKLIVVDNLTTD